MDRTVNVRSISARPNIVQAIQHPAVRVSKSVAIAARDNRHPRTNCLDKCPGATVPAAVMSGFQDVARRNAPRNEPLLDFTLGIPHQQHGEIAMRDPQDNGRRIVVFVIRRRLRFGVENLYRCLRANLQEVTCANRDTPERVCRDKLFDLLRQ
jgi:hypothetical protein